MSKEGEIIKKAENLITDANLPKSDSARTAKGLFLEAKKHYADSVEDLEKTTLAYENAKKRVQTSKEWLENAAKFFIDNCEKVESTSSNTLKRSLEDDTSVESTNKKSKICGCDFSAMCNCQNFNLMNLNKTTHLQKFLEAKNKKELRQEKHQQLLAFQSQRKQEKKLQKILKRVEHAKLKEKNNEIVEYDMYLRINDLFSNGEGEKQDHEDSGDKNDEVEEEEEGDIDDSDGAEGEVEDDNDDGNEDDEEDSAQ